MKQKCMKRSMVWAVGICLSGCVYMGGKNVSEEDSRPARAQT